MHLNFFELPQGKSLRHFACGIVIQGVIIHVCPSVVPPLVTNIDVYAPADKDLVD